MAEKKTSDIGDGVTVEAVAAPADSRWDLMTPDERKEWVASGDSDPALWAAEQRLAEARAIADLLGNALDGCDDTTLRDPGVRRLFKRRRSKAMKAWRNSSWYR